MHRPAATARSHQRRTLVEIKMAAHSVKCLGGQVRWVPGELVLSDCLTERAGQATLMRSAMSQGKYGITEEAIMTILKDLATTSKKYNRDVCEKLAKRK